MKDATLVTVAPVIGMTMQLESATSRREVSGEIIGLSLFGSRETRKATATATGESAHGAQLLAYEACMRAFIADQPFPEAFKRDIERLEEERP